MKSLCLSLIKTKTDNTGLTRVLLRDAEAQAEPSVNVFKPLSEQRIVVASGDFERHSGRPEVT